MLAPWAQGRVWQDCHRQVSLGVACTWPGIGAVQNSLVLKAGYICPLVLHVLNLTIETLDVGHQSTLQQNLSLDASFYLPHLQA